MNGIVELLSSRFAIVGLAVSIGRARFCSPAIQVLQCSLLVVSKLLLFFPCLLLSSFLDGF